MALTSGPPPIVLLAGPQLIGFMFNWGLIGILCVQVYIYYVAFPHDPKVRKTLVYTLFVLEWTQTGLVTADAFDSFVYDWGKPDAFGSFHSTWFSVPLMSGCIAATVQICFAWRLWVFARSRILTGVVVVLALCQGSAAIALGVKLKRLPGTEDFGRETAVIVVWLAGSALVDVIIAMSMTIYLLKSKSGLAQTGILINRMIRLVIETGTVTATVAIIELILFLVSPNTLIHECPSLVLAKMYTNTLLTSFNSRAFLRRGNDVLDLSELAGRNDGTFNISGESIGGKAGDRGGAMRVEVFRETVTSPDNIALQDMHTGLGYTVDHDVKSVPVYSITSETNSGEV